VRGALLARLVAVALVSTAALAAAAEAPLAPAFKTKSVTGEPLDLEALRAHGPVVLDFWATWCKPCLTALPELEALRARHAERGLTVIGISIDGPRNFPKVRPTARRLGLRFPIVLDEDGDLQRKFQVRAVPTSILVSPEGRMVRVTPGWRAGETADLEREIEALLADTTGTATP
jgi:peroxiredoxin